MPSRARPGGTRRSVPAVVAGALVLVAFSVSLSSVDRTRFNDEELWQHRSQQFATGLVTGDPHRLTAYDVELDTTSTSLTMPGIPTLWVGSAVILAECAADRAQASWSGCVQDSDGPDLPHVHLAMALLGASLVAMLWLVGRRLLGAGTAFLACFLIATEPFLATLRTMFHTDSLVMSFSLIGFVALCRALELAGRERNPVALGALAGVALAAAALTKLSAVAVLPALVVCVAWAGARAWRRQAGPAGDRLRGLMRSRLPAVVAAGVGAGLITVVVAWPALVVDPARQLGALRSSALLADEGHRQFFRGAVTMAPPWYYYLWVVAYRLTPWSFLALLAIPATLVARRIDTRWWLFGLFTASQLLVIAASAKKFDRYATAMIAGCLILTAVSIDLLVGDLVRDRLRNRPPRVAAAACVAGVIALWGHALMVADRDLTYFNPVVGGLESASGQLMVNWGEERSVADDWLDERFGESGYVLCNVRLLGMICPPGTGPRVAVTYLSNTQRGLLTIPPEAQDSWTPIGSHRLDGVELIRFWQETG
ncbi:MAG: glycosyltransferase family 39 protein [Microthrixaceae bacterium]